MAAKKQKMMKTGRKIERMGDRGILLFGQVDDNSADAAVILRVAVSASTTALV